MECFALTIVHINCSASCVGLTISLSNVQRGLSTFMVLVLTGKSWPTPCHNPDLFCDGYINGFCSFIADDAAIKIHALITQK